jgi:hypothetical protein
LWENIGSRNHLSDEWDRAEQVSGRIHGYNYGKTTAGQEDEQDPPGDMHIIKEDLPCSYQELPLVKFQNVNGKSARGAIIKADS